MTKQQYENDGILTCCWIDWNLPSKKPNKDGIILAEYLSHDIEVDYVKADIFDDWVESIVRWAYIPKEIYAKIFSVCKEDVDYWRHKYLDLLGAYHNEHQRDAFVGRNDSRSDDCDGDEHLTADDLCELFKSKDARSIGEVSVNELRDIFLEVLRKSKERERIEEDDGK